MKECIMKKNSTKKTYTPPAEQRVEKIEIDVFTAIASFE